jgi:SpoVK/Ycf46/Vps4 family AAA+-type ATPase
LLLTGNVHDLFHVPEADGRGRFQPLLELLVSRWRGAGRIVLVYELNGPVRFVDEGDRERLRAAWIRWRTGRTAEELAIARMLEVGRGKLAPQDPLVESFDANLHAATGSPTLALELLRQLCLCSRSQVDGRPLLAEDLLIIVEGAELLVPDAPVSSLSDADRRRLAICRDWFSDPGFLEADDAVVLISESRSQIAGPVARLPQLVEIEVPAPDLEARTAFLEWFDIGLPKGKKVRSWGTREQLAEATAGLSIHALSQLVKGVAHRGEPLRPSDVVLAVEAFLEAQLGEGVVEVSRPAHKLVDVVGNRRLKQFVQEELIPRLELGGAAALSGAAVAGPIGGGKTFVFEAVAGELGMIVLVLKNLRSQWFGQTDVILERLRRTLEALSKALIVVDEADTQFGGVGAEVHETERRLTGKIQAMMSDPRLRGRIVWLLMTARIHRLSPDLRRPGRVGDLIVPVLDPEGEDRRDFLRWTLGAVLDEVGDDALAELDRATVGWSAAAFAALRANLKAKAALQRRTLTVEESLAVVRDTLPAAIDETRRYQTLQALLNCTRRSLLPDPEVTDEHRRGWAAEVRALELRGLS